MKNSGYLKYLFLFSALCFLLISCQEEAIDEDLEDEDMITAILLADDFLDSQKNERTSSSDRAVTVLKYKNGKLLYSTNRDSNKGYFEVDEETITAFLKPGESMFWYSGGGVSDLEGIEFDDVSQDELDEDPEEVKTDRLWYITIPEDAEVGSILKYDIIYDYKGNDGSPIRLDPKIKIAHDDGE